MLNKNTNCYNIETNFKYSSVISTFSEHITILRTLPIDIWELKCQQRQINTTKNGKLFFCKLFRIIKFFFLMLLREATLESIVAPINRNSSAFLLHTSKTFSNIELFLIFSPPKNKNNVCWNNQLLFVYELSKNIVYIVSEHLKYCKQINEYWINKNACLNIV